MPAAVYHDARAVLKRRWMEMDSVGLHRSGRASLFKQAVGQKKPGGVIVPSSSCLRWRVASPTCRCLVIGRELKSALRTRVEVGTRLSVLLYLRVTVSSTDAPVVVKRPRSSEELSFQLAVRRASTKNKKKTAMSSVEGEELPSLFAGLALVSLLLTCSLCLAFDRIVRPQG